MLNDKNISVMTTSELIAALGGAAKVAERLGMKRTAVAMWGTIGEVPQKHHVAVWGLALEAGLSWEPPGADAIRARLAGPPAERVA